ncbi:MAG: FAD binding domain-containing protein [Synergistaceae bacterium]|jgi:CO/xanthine dehydrogenase FAD-binding subunit|nr:FAD binding domain-containing protein [Synergistaceae bacterium]
MVDGYTPRSLSEALSLLSSHGLTPYAGGTDLMTKGYRHEGYLFLHRIPELRHITETRSELRFGACCTFTEILESKTAPAILKEAVSRIASPSIRNLGTIGGNIANGSDKADSAFIFFVTDSSVRIASCRGERTVPIKDLYLGRNKLALERDELIVEVIMPKRWLGNYRYEKIGARKSLAISLVLFAGLMSIEDGKIAHCATSYGVDSGVIVRRSDIDEIMIGLTVEEARAAKDSYIKAYDGAISPGRGRVSAEYSKVVCMNLLADFLSSMGI